MEYIDQLIAATAEHLGTQPRPSSTYRLQLHAGFTFADAAALSGYLNDLGVTHAYASPYLKARAGSTHGYDVVNHGCLNSELGTREQYDAWIDSLKSHGLSHILDIVPNHMGVATNDNAWWNDVLLHGRASRYARYFDIQWSMPGRPDLNDKVLLPILGEPFGDALEKGKLSLKFEGGRIVLGYHQRRLPLNLPSLRPFFEAAAKQIHGAEAGTESGTIVEPPEAGEFAAIVRQALEEPGGGVEEGTREESAAAALAELHERSPLVQKAVQETLNSFNGSSGHPRSFDSLDGLLSQQHYRLAFWRAAAEKLNYRRFFDINDLAAIRMENPATFHDSHRLIFELIAAGKIAGLRIDHPDGLFDPAEYLRQLQVEAAAVHARRLCASEKCYAEVNWQEVEPALRRRLRQRTGKQAGIPPFPVVVEKILAADESLPQDWQADGTSGYDFLNKFSGLFIDSAGKEELTAAWQEFTGITASFPEIVRECKGLVLEKSFSSELTMLAQQLYALAQRTRAYRDSFYSALKEHLRALLIAFPVYRSYVIDGGASADDARVVDAAIHKAAAADPRLNETTLAFLRAMILLETPASFSNDDIKRQRCFAGRFQQLSSALTAKGVEDTAFYRYHRLTSLNEVGGDPEVFGTPPGELHTWLAQRQARWPYALSALATHDTKRGEDARARIHALSELPAQWREQVRRWRRILEPLRQGSCVASYPTASDEYLFYQTLIGTWPLHATQAGDCYTRRLQEYMLKAARESKSVTTWTEPVAAYETALQNFVAGAVASEPFLAEFVPFATLISRIGIVTSLSQTTLRLLAPGIPDTYQGGELWDFNLVDPDNRRPVDYARRREMLAAIQQQFANAGARPEFVRSLLAAPEDARAKMHILATSLRFRRDNQELLARGEYLPLKTRGDLAENLFAFARRHGNRWLLVAVPRLAGGLMKSTVSFPLGEFAWRDTVLELPADLAGAVGNQMNNLFTGESVKLTGSELPGARILASFPVAALALQNA